MEAGKDRFSRDTVRDATRHEAGQLRRESRDLKLLVGELSLELSGGGTAIPPLGDDGTGT